jgi:hypothetical protein
VPLFVSRKLAKQVELSASSAAEFNENLVMLKFCQHEQGVHGLVVISID